MLAFLKSYQFQEMGTEIIIIAASSVFVFILLVFLFGFVLKYQRKVLSFEREKELMRSKFNQTLLQSQLEIQEQTLQHISNELHDNLGQIASLIKINLHTIPLDNKEKAAEKLADTRELTRNLITDIKSLSVSLGTDHISRTGLAKMLEIEMKRIGKTEQFITHFEQDVDKLVIPDGKAIILYRIVQEVLNNTVKHSDARNIRVKLSGNEKTVNLEISDDGKGFDVADKIKSSEGAGLHNLQKRAALINASLNINSAIGSGCIVTIKLPV